jgi:hypothetical protein
MGTALVYATKGKNMILSSSSTVASNLRSPHDIINL